VQSATFTVYLLPQTTNRRQLKSGLAISLASHSSIADIRFTYLVH